MRKLFSVIVLFLVVIASTSGTLQAQGFERDRDRGSFLERIVKYLRDLLPVSTEEDEAKPRPPNP